MRISISRKLMIPFICLIMMNSCAVPVYAQDVNVIYSGDSGEFIFANDDGDPITDLFPNFKDVMPGDSIEQKIVVDNKASKNVKVQIYIRTHGTVSEDYRDFLNKMNLKIINDSGSVMFDSSPDQLGGLSEWRQLGTLYSGGKVNLTAVLSVPTSLDDRYQRYIGSNDYGEIRWEFYVEELPVSPYDPKPGPGSGSGSGSAQAQTEAPTVTEPIASTGTPKTGDDSKTWLWVILLVLSGVGLTASLLRRKPTDKESED